MTDLTKLPDKAPDFDLGELFEAGMHFGHPKRKWHPKMHPWIYMEKNGVHIFDLEKTAAQLKIAYNLVHNLAVQGKKVVVVGTKRQAKEVVEAEAPASGLMYITSRWLGGFLSNWKQVEKSLKRMLKIESNLESGAYKGRTKYEIVQLEKELNRLKRFFDGLRGLKSTPDCLIVIDPNREDNAIKEARMLDVPIIALIDSNSNPEMVDIPVPGNDDAVKAIEIFVKTLAKDYDEGRQEAKKQPAKAI